MITIFRTLIESCQSFDNEKNHNYSNKKCDKKNAQIKNLENHIKQFLMLLTNVKKNCFTSTLSKSNFNTFSLPLVIYPTAFLII